MVKYVDKNSETQARFAADPWPERQANLERKWGFEVCLPFVASQFHSLSLSLSLSAFLASRYRPETGVLYVYFAFPGKEMLIIQNKTTVGILRHLNIRPSTACEMPDGSGCGV